MQDKLKWIEKLEFHYFNSIFFLLEQDLEKMIKGLDSKNDIKNDWMEVFNNPNKQSTSSDFARGAERIYFWLFNQFGKPNSTPIGSDLLFETYDAFIHIDIKTCKKNNTSDYKTSIPISANQISYSNTSFKANLPYYYNKGKLNEKICLTYILNIVYDDQTLNIVSIMLSCIPNGSLETIYKKSKQKIFDKGKIKGASTRFIYKNACFSLLNEKPQRYKYIYGNEK